MQAQRPLRHNALQELRQFMIVIIGDVKISKRGAENIVGVGLGTQDCIHIDAILVVQQRDDERGNAFIFHYHASDDVATAVAVEAGVDHLQSVNGGRASLGELMDIIQKEKQP